MRTSTQKTADKRTRAQKTTDVLIGIGIVGATLAIPLVLSFINSGVGYASPEPKERKPKRPKLKKHFPYLDLSESAEALGRVEIH